MEACRLSATTFSRTLAVRYITWRGARAGRSDGRPERSCPAWRRAGSQPPRSQPKYQEHQKIFGFYFGGLERVFVFLRDVCDGIFKLLRSPGIDSKELIPPVYVACRPFQEPRNRFLAWRAGTTTLFVVLGRCPPGYIGWRNRFLRIDFWAP